MIEICNQVRATKRMEMEIIFGGSVELSFVQKGNSEELMVKIMVGECKPTLKGKQDLIAKDQLKMSCLLWLFVLNGIKQIPLDSIKFEGTIFYGRPLKKFDNCRLDVYLYPLILLNKQNPWFNGASVNYVCYDSL